MTYKGADFERHSDLKAIRHYKVMRHCTLSRIHAQYTPSDCSLQIYCLLELLVVVGWGVQKLFRLNWTPIETKLPEN